MGFGNDVSTGLYSTVVITLTLFICYYDAVICSTVQIPCTFLKYLTLLTVVKTKDTIVLVV